MNSSQKNLPDHWSFVPLQEVCTFNPKHSKDLDDNLDLSFVPMSAVSAEVGEITAPEIGKLGKVRKGYCHIADGDVIFAKITPCMENGKCAIASNLINGIGCGSTEFYVLRSGGAILPQYLYRFLRQQSYRDFASQNMTGVVGQRRVPRQFMQESCIPLPPLNEQQRIVAKIEELTDRTRKAREALEDVPQLIEQFRRSVLAAAFRGDLTADWREQNPDVEPAEKLLERIRVERRQRWEAAELEKMREKEKEPNNDKWKEKYKDIPAVDDCDLSPLPETWTYGRVCELGRVQLGRQRSPKNHTGEFMRPYLRSANVFEARIDTSDVMEMNFDPKDFEKFQLKDKDILLNEGQSLELVGRPAMYRDEVPGSCFQNTLVRFQTEDGVLPEYALLVFRLYMHNGKFQSIAQWTTNIAHLGASRFADLDFPLPPLAEQKEIVLRASKALDSIEQVRDTEKAQRKQLDRLDRAILAKAFQGQLVPQDPTDEPASQLLQRIRSEREKLKPKEKPMKKQKHP